MDVIEKDDLYAEKEENITDYLAEAIERSNQVALSNAKFQAAHFRVEIKDGSYEVTLD